MEITVKCQSIEELGVLASQLQGMSQAKAEKTEKPEVPKAEKPEVPKAEAPTLLELRAILSKDRKKAAELLAEYGVTKLTDLDSSHYAELLTKAGGM